MFGPGKSCLDHQWEAQIFAGFIARSFLGGHGVGHRQCHVCRLDSTSVLTRLKERMKCMDENAWKEVFRKDRKRRRNGKGYSESSNDDEDRTSTAGQNIELTIATKSFNETKRES